MKVRQDGSIEVTPLYHGKRGSTITVASKKAVGKTVQEAFELLKSLVPGPKDLGH